MIRYTMKDLKEMSDEDLIIRLINEKRRKLHPYSPLGGRIDKVEIAIRENAHIKTELYEILKEIYAYETKYARLPRKYWEKMGQVLTKVVFSQYKSLNEKASPKSRGRSREI